jgi:hypothetical protein
VRCIDRARWLPCVDCTMRFVRALVTVAIYRSVSASQFSTDLTIANTNWNPDGFTRDAVLANGVFPAPLISATSVMCLFSLTVRGTERASYF